MTREEILEATIRCSEDYVDLGRELTSDDIADAFEKGVYWAGKTMAKKVMQCFFEDISEFLITDPKRVESFRQAMGGLL